MIMETLIKPKRFFNVKSKKDIAEARYFFEHHSWKNGCPFILEFPHLTIPDMIKDKMIHKSLGLVYDRKHHWSSQ